MQESVCSHSRYRRGCSGYRSLNNIKPDELWVAFGTRSHSRYIPVHELTASLNSRMCSTLHVFYAFTGCDIVSSFGGRGKKTAWVTWQSYPEATDALEDLLLLQDVIGEHTMSTLERFVVLLYDRTSDITMINDCRKQLSIRKSRILENLTPTKAALQQHVKRPTYQAIWWTQALIADPKLPTTETGAVKKILCQGGNHSEPHCQKHHSHAMN